MNPTVRRWFKAIMYTLGGLVVLFGLLQLVPYGRTHSNPRRRAEPAWDSPRTRELAVRACFNCHSNETKWPWYADVAPMSWLVQFDVDTAREVMNLSEWQRPYTLSGNAGQRVRDGIMPPYKYKMAHPEANLTPEEATELARGLDATILPHAAGN